MMARTPRPPVERHGSHYVLNLDDNERGLLSRLLKDMRDLLMSEADNPALRRLFPVAYDEDPEEEAEYQRLMRQELVTSRVTAVDMVVEALVSGRFDAEAVTPLMQSLNSLRLVLGTLLDVSEDHDIDGIDPDDPRAPEHHLYAFLSWLLDWTVRAQS